MRNTLLHDTWSLFSAHLLNCALNVFSSFSLFMRSWINWKIEFFMSKNKWNATDPFWYPFNLHFNQRERKIWGNVFYSLFLILIIHLLFKLIWFFIWIQAFEFQLYITNRLPWNCFESWGKRIWQTW